MAENIPVSTNVPVDDVNKRKNKIKVSSAKSVFFYVDLATRFLKQEEEVELSGLGFGSSFFCGLLFDSWLLSFCFCFLLTNKQSQRL